MSAHLYVDSLSGRLDTVGYMATKDVAAGFMLVELPHRTLGDVFPTFDWSDLLSYWRRTYPKPPRKEIRPSPLDELRKQLDAHLTTAERTQIGRDGRW